MQGIKKSSTSKFYLAFLFAILLTSCSKSHQIDTASLTEITIISNGEIETFPANSEIFSHTIDWLNTNRDGWEVYYATPRTGEIIISSEQFTLSVSQDVAQLTYTHNEDVQTLVKSIDIQDFGYIQQ